MDGVLVDNGVYHRAAWRTLLKEIGAEPTDGEFWRLTIGRPVEEALPLLLGRRLPSWEIARYSRRKTDLYRQLSLGRLQPVAGAVAFVLTLEEAGIPRAVASSASARSVSAVLRGFGLAFPVVVTADDVDHGKPDPEIYLTAASRLSVPPRACVVFEDSLVGVEAARRAGMRVIGVTTAYTEAELRSAGTVSVLANFEGLAWETVAAG